LHWSWFNSRLCKL